MYADDTKVYREIDSDTDVQSLQEDLRIMSEWLNKWLLKFHPQKGTSIAIGNENIVHNYELSSEYDDHQMEQVQEFANCKFLLTLILKLFGVYYFQRVFPQDYLTNKNTTLVI